jgi:hypothetical protein
LDQVSGYKFLESTCQTNRGLTTLRNTSGYRFNGFDDHEHEKKITCEDWKNNISAQQWLSVHEGTNTELAQGLNCPYFTLLPSPVNFFTIIN